MNRRTLSIVIAVVLCVVVIIGVSLIVATALDGEDREDGSAAERVTEAIAQQLSGEDGEQAPEESEEQAEEASADPLSEASSDPDGVPEAVTAYIVIRGFEWGPGVNKVVLELDEPVDAVCPDEYVYIYTTHWDREVTAVYLSNRMGYEVEGSSQYVTFDLATSYDCGGSPFEYDPMGTQHNYWAETYPVIADITVEEGGETFAIHFEGDCIDNHFSPDVVAFTELGTFSGEYFNTLGASEEPLSLNYAVYEPERIAGGEKNPLIIWLHGRGEGGDDIEITLLANEVSALTEAGIQSHFTAGDEVGAYVLVPQNPTYWRDAGDGVEHVGDMPSRYQEILMDLINWYLETNPDVDPERVYLIGASNGGYMVLEMLYNYPDAFAAGVPVSPGTSYNLYARDFDGSYRQVFGQGVTTGDTYVTDEMIEVLKQAPIWIVGSASDTITPALEYSAPLYYALVSAGAENCWCTMYMDVIGQETANTRYLGHWAWIYLLNDQVSYVQDPDKVAESSEDTFFYGMNPNRDGGTMLVPDGNGSAYRNLYDWLNDQ